MRMVGGGIFQIKIRDIREQIWIDNSMKFTSKKCT